MLRGSSLKPLEHTGRLSKPTVTLAVRYPEIIRSKTENTVFHSYITPD